jgi:hypothetical protein
MVVDTLRRLNNHIPRLVLVGAFAVLWAPTVWAQEVVVRGVTLADSTLEPIRGAHVAFPALALQRQTSNVGRFDLGPVPAPGRYRLVVQHLGYAPVDTMLDVSGTDTVRLLLRRLRFLDSVVVEAERSLIPGFDERRLAGSGHFLTRADLDRRRNSSTGDILSRVPGVRVNRGTGGVAWISATRGAVSVSGGRRPEESDLRRGAPPNRCYVDVYLDGIVVFGGAGGPLFDVNSVPANQIEAIEYYSGASQVPAKFNRTGAACGVLVIWTRR